MIPILVLCYIRIDTLKQTFESVIQQPHGDIYVSCDGPSSEYLKLGDEVHNYLRSLKHQGIIKDLRIGEVNEGTLHGVSQGIDWFFTKVNVGIIIEDDLVLHAELLSYAELCEKFLSMPKVLSIGFHNPVPVQVLQNPHPLVRASRFVVSWGWMTSKEKWDSRVKSFGQVKYWELFILMYKSIGLNSALYHLYFYLINSRKERKDNRRCNWDDLWQINSFLSESKNIAFNYNLVTNIGFGFGATHTKEMINFYPLRIPTWNPDQIIQFSMGAPDFDLSADQYLMKNRKIQTILRAKMRIRSRVKSLSRMITKKRI